MTDIRNNKRENRIVTFIQYPLKTTKKKKDELENQIQIAFNPKLLYVV